jgi:hypothetical protein
MRMGKNGAGAGSYARRRRSSRSVSSCSSWWAASSTALRLATARLPPLQFPASQTRLADEGSGRLGGGGAEAINATTQRPVAELGPHAAQRRTSMYPSCGVPCDAMRSRSPEAANAAPYSPLSNSGLLIRWTARPVRRSYT